MSPYTRALVLCGGGTAGGGWILGMLHGLREAGLDLDAADLIVGTSAGARSGAVLRGGELPRVVDMYRSGGLPKMTLPADMAAFTAAIEGALAGASDRTDATRRMASLGPIGPRLASGEARRAMMAAHVSGNRWPQHPLQIVAVEAESGERRAFDAASGVGLLDAVTASGALPGIYPLVEIDGRRYADGGVHSPSNLDLAAGHDLVVVLKPLNSPLADAVLAAETAEIAPARVHVISADAGSTAAIGPNPLLAETAPAALEAGTAQAARELDGLRAAWSGPR